MIHVILVDDEEIITNGLVDFVRWKSYDMEVVGVAGDGKKALSLVKELFPDVVITDIKMPFLDGLEFMKEARKIIPDGLFVFISGYDNFHYAQSAIRLGAYDYILKPIDIDHFHDLLNRILLEFKKKTQVTKKNQSSIYGMRKDFFIELLYNDITQEEIKDRVKVHDLGLYSWLQVVLFQLHCQPSEKVNISNVLIEIGNRVYNEPMPPLIQIGKCEFLAVCMGKGKIETQDIVHSLLKETRIVLENIGYDVTAGIGTMENHLHLIHRSFQSAKSSLNRKFVIGKNIDIYFEHQIISEKRGLEVEILHRPITEIVQDVKYLKRKSLKKKLDDMEDKIKQFGDPYHNAQIVVTDIFLAALNILHDMEIPVQELFPNPIQENIAFLKSETIEEVFGKLYNLLSAIMTHIEEKKPEKNYVFGQKSKEYIDLNYMRPDLSLAEVAYTSCLSTNYFTMVFKAYFNKTFVEYVTDIRINMAKELLLLSDLKVYEISYKIGYENPSYFSSVFKKKTGFTPNNFRNYTFHSKDF